MTPAQLAALVCYPRDKKGDLRPPAPPGPPAHAEPSPERDRMALESMRAFLRPEKYERALADLAAFWESKGG
jgi:hypothetical protein